MAISNEEFLRAAEKGDLESLREAVDAGLDANWKDGQGWTPLLAAARAGQPESVALLHELGADLTVPMPNGANILHLAIEKAGERPRNFKVTVTRDGEKVTLTDPDEIRAAVGSHPDDEYMQCVQVVKYCLEKGVSHKDVTQPQGQQPLSSAAGWGCTEIVELLCARDGVDINHKDKSGVSALHKTLAELLAP